MRTSSHGWAAAHRSRWFPVLLAVALLAPLAVGQRPNWTSTAAAADAVDFRVNAGGPSLTGTPAWSADTSGTPSPYVNASQTGNSTFSTATAIDMSDPSIPAGTPAQLFQ